MNTFIKSNRRHALIAAVSLALGTGMGPQTASATVYTFEWTGLFTMLDPNGGALTNSSSPYNIDPTWGFAKRTPVAGTFAYDDVTGAGTMTINSFDFFSGGPAIAHDVTTQTIGDGIGGAGTLMAGHLLFDWNSNNNINVGIIFDASGMLNALPVNIGDSITGGAIPASNVTNAPSAPVIGASPIATTLYDTDYHNTPACVPNTCLLSGGSGDTIGGDPMDNGPFPGFSANFDITSMTLVSDGTGPSFTAPADPDETEVGAIPTDIVPVNLGTVNDELAPPSDATCDVVVEYDIGNGWTIDDDGTNTENVTLTGPVTTLSVDWRATTTAGVPGTCLANSLSTATQNVTVTIDDTTAPTFDTFPGDFSVSVNSTTDTISFEGPTSGQGTVTASDAVDATPTIQWSLDGLNWTTDTVAVDESSSEFNSGPNTVYWRVVDAAGNTTTQEQTVTVNLPTGIFGQPCTVDVDLLNAAIGDRAVTGIFKMRDRAGNPVGETDETVTGTINTAAICADESCTDSGAALATTQTFFTSLWDTEAIRLFGPGTYTFDACPSPISGNVAGEQGIASDGSTKCDADNTLTMTVGPGQLGGHMLFNWSVTNKIDVAVVWEYSCGAAELVQVDPDGDGIIGTKMVDGPFKDFNAAFDLTTISGEQHITNGGYTVSIPTVNNPTAGASPLPIDPGTTGTALGGISFTAAELAGTGASDDSRVVTSCVGGCFDFSVSGRTTTPPLETIQVVLPLSTPIPYYSLYRKYNAGTDSWTAFVVNNTDNVKTAVLDANGRCPEPGAGDYTSYSNGILAGMLRPDDQCVQLTITDNGPNDDDPAAGVIADPSGVGLTSAPAAPEAQTTDGGGGGCAISTNTSATQRLDLWLLASLMAFFGLRRKTQQK